MSTLKVANIESQSGGGVSAKISDVGGGPLSNRNKIINGAMTIDQRNAGAAVTVNNLDIFYGTDRFRAVGQSAAGVFTLQQTSDAPAKFVNSLKVTVTTADASIGTTERYIVQQVIEGNNASDLSFGTADASTVAISFWVKSSLTGSFGGCLQNNAPDRSYPFTYTINAANTWEYKTIIISGDTTGTWATDNTGWGRLTWSIGSGTDFTSTAGSWQTGNFEGVTSQVQLISTLNATWQITGVQLEVGDFASSFEHRSYGDELARCQRYFVKYSTQSLTGRGSSATSTVYDVPLAVTMRATPSVNNLSIGAQRRYDNTTASGAGAGNVGTLVGGTATMDISSLTSVTDNYTYWLVATWDFNAEL